MPLFWLSVPHAPENLVAPGRIETVTRQAASIVRQIDSQLTVEAPFPSYDFLTQEAVFEGGVVARYGVTKIESRKLRLSNLPGKKTGVAEDGVVLTDPDVSIKASRLEFSWDPLNRRFVADNVEIRVAGAIIRARHADLTPTLWKFEDVSLTTCGQSIPLYLVTAPSLTLIPGKRGSVKNPSIFLRGKRILTLPGQSFNLDRRTIGLRPPGPGYRQDAGVGLNWISGTMLNESTSLTANFDTFPRSLPGYGLLVTKSFVKADESVGLVAPRSELGERFNFGYFETVEVASPGGEEGFLRGKRDSLSFGSTWNQGVAARLDNPPTSKAFEVAYEKGGAIGELAGITQIRLQTINERRDPFLTRLVTQGSLLAPSVSLGHGISTLTRFDASAFIGRDRYGWARGSAGLVFQPNKVVRFGATYVLAGETGTPSFEFDRLYAMSGYAVRADFDLGSTRFTLMHKYDSKRGWYDREMSGTQVIGCLEAFFLSRQFPRDYRIGIRLRLDPFLDLLQRRKLERSPSRAQITTQPSGLP